MAKREYFIVAHSFAAPFVSDESTGFTWGLIYMTPSDGPD